MADLVKAKEISNKNLESYFKNDCQNDGNGVGFKSSKTGQWIFAPFYDESLMEEVDPVEYYGNDFLSSGFCN